LLARRLANHFKMDRMILEKALEIVAKP
jgi:hypothetical protein